MKHLFGTDGIRGVANTPPMTAEMALSVGRAIGLTAAGGLPANILIGRDTRISGDMLEAALTAGICSVGGNVLVAGVLPTPGIAFLARDLRMDAGVVISASHNPYEDNGIKVFRGDGFKLSDEEEAALERLIRSDEPAERSRQVRDMGRCRRVDYPESRYVDFLVSTLRRPQQLKNLRVVLDCANGATSRVALLLFDRLRVRFEAIHHSPDGRNINQNCGSQHPEEVTDRVRASKADIGLAFDGDGDRLIAVDETGAPVSGDRILAICARHLRERGRLANDTVVSTVMSNIGLKIALREMGVHHRVTDVGDRYVMEEMRASGAILGGEDSGHMILLDRHTTGDGLVTALALLEVMGDTGRPLSDLARVMTVYPQILMNVPVASRPDISTIPAIRESIEEVERRLGDRGRVLVRYSGTQPLCRVMVEGPDEAETRSACEEIVAMVRREIGG